MFVREYFNKWYKCMNNNVNWNIWTNRCSRLNEKKNRLWIAINCVFCVFTSFLTCKIFIVWTASRCYRPKCSNMYFIDDADPLWSWQMWYCLLKSRMQMVSIALIHSNEVNWPLDSEYIRYTHHILCYDWHMLWIWKYRDAECIFCFQMFLFLIMIIVKM